MNEELQKALGELLQKTSNGIDNASGFLTEQIPDVVQQLLTWHATYSLALSVMCLVLLFIAIKIDVKLFFIVKDVGDEEFFIVVYFLFGSLLRAAAYLPLILNMSLDWLQIWIAPKVWLLEYTAKLAN